MSILFLFLHLQPDVTAQPHEEALAKGSVSANGYAKGHQAHLFAPVLDL